MGKNTAIKGAAKIVSAYIANHTVRQDELPELVCAVHTALVQANSDAQSLSIRETPFVGRSVTPDYIISLESGRRLKTLKRYLKSKYGLTPEQYRAKWGLPADYPMVAPNYSTKRRSIAVTNGFGRMPTSQL
jgi:predicted transcriptional regulator